MARKLPATRRRDKGAAALDFQRGSMLNSPSPSVVRSQEMSDTPFTRLPRNVMPAEFHLAWDTLNGLTGDATFVEVFAQHPAMLDFVMNKFYGPVFFGGQVDNRYKQLARLKLLHASWLSLTTKFHQQLITLPMIRHLMPA